MCGAQRGILARDRHEHQGACCARPRLEGGTAALLLDAINFDDPPGWPTVRVWRLAKAPVTRAGHSFERGLLARGDLVPVAATALTMAVAPFTRRAPVERLSAHVGGHRQRVPRGTWLARSPPWLPRSGIARAPERAHRAPRQRHDHARSARMLRSGGQLFASTTTGEMKGGGLVSGMPRGIPSGANRPMDGGRAYAPGHTRITERPCPGAYPPYAPGHTHHWT